MTSEPVRQPKKSIFHHLAFDVLLAAVLLAGAYFRLRGLFWGEYQYLHPDERFLVWVGSDISPVQSIAEYFDTANSSLNPHNRGHGFYVYGTLPMFITRYAVQAVFGHSGFQEMTQIGRALSALADLLVVLLVFLIGERLYDRRVGLLGAAFSAAAVLQIQQSHFFTMDTFINFFTMLAFYIAVLVVKSRRAKEILRNLPTEETVDGDSETRVQEISNNSIDHFFKHPFFVLSILFGVALGMAVASKLNAAPMALALPVAMALWILDMEPHHRERFLLHAFGYLVLAAVVSLIVFRLGQPYAFAGPGVFGVTPNQKWVDNIKELRAQSNGDADFPPSLQWARRSHLFSVTNMVLWGMGLPYGLLAWAGFLWVGYRMLKGDWRRHMLLWGWTAIYFTWQSMALNPTMRYQLPIYPTLAVFAGWFVISLFDASRVDKRRSWLSAAAVLLGGAVLAATYAYAYAFSGIYDRPITRVEASRWIYQNIPGAINLRIQTSDMQVNQPAPFPYEFRILPEVPYISEIKPNATGTLSEIYLPEILEDGMLTQERTLVLDISADPGFSSLLATATLKANLPSIGELDTKPQAGYTLSLSQAVPVQKDQSIFLRFSLPEQPVQTALTANFSLRISPEIESAPETFLHQPLQDTPLTFGPSQDLLTSFIPNSNGFLSQILLSNVTGADEQRKPVSVEVSISVPEEDFGTAAGILIPQDTSDGQGYLLQLQEPVMLMAGAEYQLKIVMTDTGGVYLRGAGLANEGEWDDGLPLRLDNYDGFGGIYPQDLNFNMYWDDNTDKLARFTRILDEAEYIVITSNRQWGSLPRLPERFPMTTVYYRNLLGCPVEREITWCYSVARPGMFQTNLGFDLVQTFQSNPTLGALSINDQFAEEAFHVYDHPKVLIFRKNSDYDSQKVQGLLSAVDFSSVVRIPPMHAGAAPANLLLPEDRLAEQRAGGAWAELFNINAPQNQNQFLCTILWYLTIALLGWITYPLVRMALPGLVDGGYPLARAIGMLVLAYLVWLAGSFRIPFSRLTISIVLFLMTLGAVGLTFLQRRQLVQELKQKSRYFLYVEALALSLFIVDLLIRLGNPDLWHPWKGGEKPMDFSYFNAILKSTSFPPYDPWYTGGYLNYYYFGFVFAGVLVKWLGIVPAVAYNLILPTIFMLIGLGAFSLGWNLIQARQNTHNTAGEEGEQAHREPETANPKTPYWIGTSAALGMALLGNLGIVRMIFQGCERLVAPGGVIENASTLTHWVWAIQGLGKLFLGDKLPYGIGDWYWIPSRVIPAPGDVEPITEFPFFTVLYGDPHAHLYAMPIALIALAFALSLVLTAGRWKSGLSGVLCYLLGGLSIGALRPTNTWDTYLYIPLALVAITYVAWFLYKPQESWLMRFSFFATLPTAVQRTLVMAGQAVLLLFLTSVLYKPYSDWYMLGYGKVIPWEGTHTPMDSYLTHWGLFLFVIVSWMVWETRDWMASTPLSALQKYRPHRHTIQAVIITAAVLLLAIITGLTLLKVRIAWFVLPIALWAGILLLRQNQTDTKRFVLFIVATGLVMTLFVEVFVLQGDIGRMNTVFKIYLQVWTLFAVSAAAALGWLLAAIPKWLSGWRYSWAAVFLALVASAALYPLMATRAKIEDRMVMEAPHTLDGMKFMETAHYVDEWGDMDLGQDYRAIQWLQQNVKGSPVIVEANLRNLYHWGSRMTIYTGLPGVVGWEWHQQQQRASTPQNQVSNRIAEIETFYTTTDLGEARAFLRKYDVRYIILGQQELGHYPGPGLEKFSAANGSLWREVYREQSTVIYEVIDQ